MKRKQEGSAQNSASLVEYLMLEDPHQCTRQSSRPTSSMILTHSKTGHINHDGAVGLYGAVGLH